MATVHVSEAEAARDLSTLVDRVRDGADVAVERDSLVVAHLRRPGAEFQQRTLKESLAIAREIERERGYKVVLDDDFVADMEEVIRGRNLGNVSDWD